MARIFFRVSTACVFYNDTYKTTKHMAKIKV